MLKEFTFICVSFNQEKEVIEHLESIKSVIEHFGLAIKNDLIVADDQSSDNTVLNVEKWVEKNKKYFRNTYLLTTDTNMGTVKNMLRAVDFCKTEQFKILAGDDKYNDYNIYELYQSIGKEIIITPVLPFGNFNNRETELIISFRRSYRLLIDYNKKNNVGELLLSRNYIFAPGAFISGSYWRNEKIRELLSNFKYVEDIPMWMMMLYDWKTQIRFESKPYISYRISGNETLGANKGRNLRQVDFVKMKEIYPQRMSGYKKYLSPIYFKYLIKKTILTFSRRYDGFFMKNEAVRNTYIDSVKG